MYTHMCLIFYITHIWIYTHTQGKLTSAFSSSILDLFCTYRIYMCMFCIFILRLLYMYRKDQEQVEKMEKKTPRFLKVIWMQGLS